MMETGNRPILLISEGTNIGSSGSKQITVANLVTLHPQGSELQYLRLAYFMQFYGCYPPDDFAKEKELITKNFK
jgi:hypothetical protein